MDGIILIDKPKGFTSFNVVDLLKKRFKLKKVGHGGTLDPIATGLLVVLIGKATKSAQNFINDSKKYFVNALLGTTTDTYDVSGKIISKSSKLPSEDEIKKALNSFKGELEQRPPLFSALKFKGQRLYKLARLGKKIIPQKRKITIYSLENLALSIPDIFFEIECSKGTYIRSLCNDLGEMLECGAVLKNLRRMKCGRFELKNAVSVDELKKVNHKEELEKFIISYR